MLLEKLKDFNYYKTKFPLYLRDSYGFLSHFEILWELINAVDNYSDSIFKGIDVLNLVYTDDNNEQDDLLDKIGYLYGISRTFSVTYTDESGAEVTSQLKLTNRLLLMLIKTRIIQNNYKGTYEESRTLYDKIGLPIVLLTGETRMTVNCYLELGLITIKLTDDEIKDLQSLFKSGLFTLKSMGIIYNYSLNDVNQLAIWDSTNVSKQWDKGRWGF